MPLLTHRRPLIPQLPTDIASPLKLHLTGPRSVENAPVMASADEDTRTAKAIEVRYPATPFSTSTMRSTLCDAIRA